MPSSIHSGFAPDGELLGARALIVDDDADFLALEELLLTSFGLTVTTATCGDDAFRVFQANRPDVLISDIQMPNGDGLELIRRIRALDPVSGGLTPAIAVSGAATLAATLDAGFHLHFKKPMPAQPLIDAIRSFVREEKPGRETWTLGLEGSNVTIRLQGHVTTGDMRAMTTALVPMLAAATGSIQMTSDLSRLVSFTPGVAAFAQLALWDVREKIKAVTVVGGTLLARSVSRSVCLMLGVPYDHSDASDD